MSGFAQAVREGAFAKGNHRDLVEETVSTTLAYVAQAFRSNNRKGPRLDNDGKTCFILQEHYRGYSNQDKGNKKQKALPVLVLRKLMDLAMADKENSLSWLCIRIFFFAMRSWEYLKSSHKGNSKRIKINNMRNKTIHMFKTVDELMRPVIAWATAIRRTLDTIPGASEDTKVCSFNDCGKITEIDLSYARAKILIGEGILKFSKEDVGLHSIRYRGVMAMFLSGVSDIITQRIGRWESNAFLEYIREQVEKFTCGVSEKMLYNEGFQHLDLGTRIEGSNDH